MARASFVSELMFSPHILKLVPVSVTRWVENTYFSQILDFNMVVKFIKENAKIVYKSLTFCESENRKVVVDLISLEMLKIGQVLR
jgi:hypothetical protein